MTQYDATDAAAGLASFSMTTCSDTAVVIGPCPPA
jgi:hypothetical protein